MKKVFLYLLTSFSFFFLINNVNAFTITSAEILEKTGLSISFANEEKSTNVPYTYSSNTLPSDVLDFINDDDNYSGLDLSNSGVVYQVGGGTYSTNNNTIIFATYDNSLINVKFYDIYSVGINSIVFYDLSNNIQNYGSTLVKWYLLYYDSSTLTYSWKLIDSSSLWNTYYDSYVHTSYGGFGALGTVLKRSTDIYDNSSNIVFEHNWNISFSPPGPTYILKDSFGSNNNDELTINLEFNKRDVLNLGLINFKLELQSINAGGTMNSSLKSVKLYGRDTNDIVNYYEEITRSDILDYLTFSYEETTASGTGYYNLVGSWLSMFINSYYEDFKIEFVFENSEETLFRVYDDTDFTNWSSQYSFLDGYTRYLFNSNSAGMAISYNSDYTGKIYIESKYITDKNVLFKVGNFFYETNKKGDEIIPISSLEGYGNYSYYDFSLLYTSVDDSSNHIVILSHVSGGSDCYVYIPNNLTVSEITYNSTDDEYSFIMNTPNGSSTYIPGTDYSFGDDDFITSISSAIDYFISPIRYITSLIADFFYGLSSPFKVLFIALFGISISIFIVRFLL